MAKPSGPWAGAPPLFYGMVSRTITLSARGIALSRVPGAVSPATDESA